MRLDSGMIVKLQVSRKVDFGYFLSDGYQDVLLHGSEATKPLEVGEDLEVFLYHDTQDRLAATMHKPLVTLGQMALLEVVDIHPRFGCFLDIGLSRHVLLPVRELPELPELHPQVGDRIFAVLGHDKQGRLLAKTAGERELAEKTFRAPTVWKNQWIEGWVYKPLQMGSFVLCDGGVLGFGAFGFIHESERTKLLRLGERVRARVTFVREDGRVNLSMRLRKEQGREEDSDKILAFLKERPNGAMPYSDETPADLIQQRFQMSKSSFKRAVGKLMKQGLVYQKGSWTHLKAEDMDS